MVSAAAAASAALLLVATAAINLPIVAGSSKWAANPFESGLQNSGGCRADFRFEKKRHGLIATACTRYCIKFCRHKTPPARSGCQNVRG